MNAVTILPTQTNQGNPFQQADLLDPIEEVLEALHQGQLSHCTQIVDYGRLLHLIRGLEAFPLSLHPASLGTK